MSGIVDGKRALVVGVANKRSIAWAIARRLDAEGARVALTFQGERVEKDVTKLAAELINQPVPVVPMDVTDDAQMDAAVAAAADGLGGLDILVHAVAFARADDLGGRFVGTPRDGFNLALDISAYSLVALARAGAPLMEKKGGGSILTLSYLGSERVFTNYNVMGVAKAALEASVRYLAADLGPRNIRVNAISAGPIKTLAASGIPGFSTILTVYRDRAPLRRSVETAEEIGRAHV